MMTIWVLVAGFATLSLASDLPPTCDRKVYCDSDILHYVQLAQVFNDSKTFVDLAMNEDEETTLNNFQKLLNETNNDPSKKQLEEFVDNNFHDGSELEDWQPEDFHPSPAFLRRISDPDLRQFGKDVHEIWNTLGRRIKQTVRDHPEQYSLILVPNPFIIPGGRFKEIYYWDTYWIIEGLLISGMEATARGMIENLFSLFNKIGLVPNGSRWYYQRRSQPPLLTAMMYLYMKKTRDYYFLRKYISTMEAELEYWLDTHMQEFEHNGKRYKLAHYDSVSSGPRPESYYEDYTDSLKFETEERREEFYADIKSAAESGWDFSARWFITDNGTMFGNLTDIHTRQILPVELNAILANAFQIVANFRGALGFRRKASIWGARAQEFRVAIEEVLWDEEDGIWHDYDLSSGTHRKYFFPTNFSPLWLKTVGLKFLHNNAHRVLDYLLQSPASQFPGGVPSSLYESGEQWDFPNAWPPLVSMVVNGIHNIGTQEALDTAEHLAQTWVRSNRKGFLEHGQMFEKYDAVTPGQYGGGGEYAVQEGFGWSNGVVLEFLDKYGSLMTAYDDAKSEKSKDS